MVVHGDVRSVQVVKSLGSMSDDEGHVASMKHEQHSQSKGHSGVPETMNQDKYNPERTRQRTTALCRDA
jgi:hypothetical protein